MNKKIIIPAILALVIGGGGGFASGMKYSQGKAASARAAAAQQFRQGGGNFAGRRGTGGPGSGFVSGEVLSKDDKSVTIKLPDGSTKIVFYGAGTKVAKTAEGAISDVAVGGQAVITGTANGDGSVTAQNIQLRPKP